MSKLKRLLGEQSPNGQLIFYESGNIFAASSAAGGLVEFGHEISSIFAESADTLSGTMTLFSEHADAAATAGIISVIVLKAVFDKTIGKVSETLNSTANIAGTACATALVGYAIGQDASFITTSACTFAAGSGLLKYAKDNPFFLKFGGLTLATGGAFLCAFGVESLAANDFESVTSIIVDSATILSGAVVTPAYFMVYDGGAFLTSQYDEENPEDQNPKGLIRKAIHPTKGWLAKGFTKYVDGPVLAANNCCKKTFFSWIPKTGLAQPDQPFWTSMWARLPTRGIMGIAAGAQAASSGQDSWWYLAGACGLWALGDVATGCMEFMNRPSTTDTPETAPNS